MTSGGNPFIASRKCIRNFPFMRILDATIAGNEGSFIPSSRSMNVLYRRFRSPHDRMLREHGTSKIIYSRNLSLKGPFQGKVFLFPLRGNYLSPGQLNINEERRKKNELHILRVRKSAEKDEEGFKDMTTRNCMIINAMNVSPESFNFNISEKT
jgi:hypothetical protein